MKAEAVLSEEDRIKRYAARTKKARERREREQRELAEGGGEGTKEETTEKATQPQPPPKKKTKKDETKKKKKSISKKIPAQPPDLPPQTPFDIKDLSPMSGPCDSSTPKPVPAAIESNNNNGIGIDNPGQQQAMAGYCWYVVQIRISPHRPLHFYRLFVPCKVT